jgi:thiol-disulfide isomerase/thioredoxin
MHLRSLLLAGVVALVGLGGFLLLQTTTVTEQGFKVGRVPVAAAACHESDCMPVFRASTVEGTELSDESLRGKTVLINFWATWCKPCVKEMPELESLWRTHGPDNFVIIGIAVDGTDESVAEFARTRGVTYPIVRANSTIDRAFGRPALLPTSYLYGPDGHLRQQWTQGLLASDIEPVLGTVLTH